MALEKSRSLESEAGFSLAETMVAVGLLATALVTLAQLFGISTRGNIASRNTTFASVLAEQKLEELRALTWGFDSDGLPVSDDSTNTAVNPEQPRTWTELMFLSFALLSSTGIGDVIPIKGPARALASVEMFVGVMYLAAVVSRLIGLTLQRR